MTVRALLFDLGNTLLEYAQAGRWRQFRLKRLEEIYPLVSEELGAIPLAPAEFAARVGEIIVGETARAIEGSGRSWHFAERLKEGLAAVGLRPENSALWRLTDMFYEPVRAGMRPYTDTRETLEGLKGLGMGLAVVTNSPWDTPGRLLRGDLEQWALEGFFEAFICSGDVPWRKPSAEFMLAAAEALEIPPSECMVVGDSLESDIAGAGAAEMRSVWVNRDGAPLPVEGPRPDFAVRSLGEVVRIFRRAS